MSLDTTRIAVLGTVATIVLLALATGPLVGAVQVPAGDAFGDAIGQGNATVTVASVPDVVHVREGQADTAVYYVEVPDADLELADVRGRPILAYELDVPPLGYSRSAVHVVDASNEGRYALGVDRGSLDPDRIDAHRYDGRLRIVLRGDGPDRVLYDSSVAVEVTR